MSSTSHLEKTCVVCGRRIEWRKKWEKNWDDIRYCSDGCRKNKNTNKNNHLELAILSLLHPRGAGKTICPSEVARQEFPETWREEMEAVRQAARRLVAQGLLEITQQGHVVDASTAKGAIRLRLTPQGRQKK